MDKMDTGQAVRGTWASSAVESRVTIPNCRLLLGLRFSHEYTGIMCSLNTSAVSAYCVLGFTWRQLCLWNTHLGQMLLETTEDEDSRGMAGWMSQDTTTS